VTWPWRHPGSRSRKSETAKRRKWPRRTLTGIGEPRPLNQSPFGQTGETSPSRDKLCLGGGPHADGACHCCSCVHRVRIDRGRTRLVRVPAADGQRTSSVTSGGQLAVLVALRSAPRRERLRDRMKLFAAVHESGYVHEAASSVGALCFQLFVYRFSNSVAGHRQSRRLLRYDSTPAPRAST
jgi:hypothetical protein